MTTTLDELQQRLEGNPNLSDEERKELLDMIAAIRCNAGNWSNLTQAEDINELLSAAAGPEDPTPSFHDRLMSLEAAHPEIALLIGRLANMLSRTGI